MQAESVAGFEIEVLWAKAKRPTPDTLPDVQEGGFKHLMYVTSGKAETVQGGGDEFED